MKFRQFLATLGIVGALAVPGAVALDTVTASPAQAATGSFCNHTGRDMSYRSGTGVAGTLRHNQCATVSGFSSGTPRTNGYVKGSNGFLRNTLANYTYSFEVGGNVVYRWYSR